MQRLFSYVGDSYAAERVAAEPPSAPLKSVQQLIDLLRDFDHAGLQGAEDMCTYVADHDVTVVRAAKPLQELPTALVDTARLPNGDLQDDVGLVMIRVGSVFRTRECR